MIGIYIVTKNMTIEQHATGRARLQEAGAPEDAMRLHSCFGEDGQLQVFDLWDSRRSPARAAGLGRSDEPPLAAEIGEPARFMEIAGDIFGVADRAFSQLPDAQQPRDRWDLITPGFVHHLEMTDERQPDDHADDTDPRYGADGRLALTPTEYLQRQVRVSPLRASQQIAGVPEQAPPDLLAFCSDYPHVEGTADAVAICERQLRGVDADVPTSFFAGAGDLIGV